MVRLKYANGEISHPMPRVNAAFIVAFTLAGPRPEILEDANIQPTQEAISDE